MSNSRVVKLYNYINVTDGELVCYTYNMSYSKDYLLVNILDITIELPPIEELNPQIIEILEAKKQKIKADAFVKCQEIDNRINELKCLEYKPTEHIDQNDPVF